MKESGLGARTGRVLSKYVPVVGLRMVRMFPPWSIGLVVNRTIKDYINGEQK